MASKRGTTRRSKRGSKRGSKKSKFVQPNIPRVRMNKTEVKRWDLDTNVPIVSTAGSVTRLVGGIIGGTASNQRVGNKIYCKYLRMQAIIVFNSAAAAGILSSTCRILVFVDTQATNGSVPTVAQVLESTTAGFGTISPINSDWTERFTVLLNKIVSVSRGGPGQLSTKGFKKCNFDISYVGAPVNNEDKNAIYMLIISGDAGVDGPAAYVTTRVVYTDR